MDRSPSAPIWPAPRTGSVCRDDRPGERDDEGVFWVPAFQFDLRDLSIRDDGRTLARWFARANGWLDGRRPADLLAGEAPAVLQAAGVTRYIASVAGAAA